MVPRFAVYDAIEAGAFPKWKFGVQIVPEEREHEFDFGSSDFALALFAARSIYVICRSLGQHQDYPGGHYPRPVHWYSGIEQEH